MPDSSGVRNSQAARAARVIPHDGEVVALTSCSNLPASRSAHAWRDDAIHRLDQVGREVAVGAEASRFFCVGVCVDVATLAGERARHRVETDDADLALRGSGGDELRRDLFAFHEFAQAVEAGGQRHQDFGVHRAEAHRLATGFDGDGVVVGARGGGGEQRPVFGTAEAA
jgi:hypothetical protein